MSTMADGTENLVQATIEILGNSDLSDDEIEHQVGALAQDAMLARRLIDVIPEAFGLIFVSHFKSAETMELPSTFSAKDAHGDWQSFPFKREPIFIAAALAAQAMFHNGPRRIFQTVTDRSSILNTVNKALNQSGLNDDSCLAGARLGGPSFLGIPAEIYSAN